MKAEYFITILGKNITEISSNCDTQEEYLDISKWDGKSIHDSDILFVLPANKLSEFEEACEQNVHPCVILSDSKESLQGKYNPRIPYISSPLPLDTLWTEIRHSFHLIQRYDHILMNGVLQETSMFEALEKASNYWGASFYIFNEGGQLICSAEHEKTKNTINVEELDGASFFDLYDSCRPLEKHPNLRILNRPFSKDVVFLKKLNAQKTTHWMIVSGNKEIEIALSYSLRATGLLLERLISEGHIRPKDYETDFSKRFGSILSGETTDITELRRILFGNEFANTNTNLSQYYQILLIGANNGPLDVATSQELIKELRQNLSNARFAIYGGEIICVFFIKAEELATWGNYINKLAIANPAENHSWLRTFLAKNNLKGVLDDANSKVTTLRASYSITHDALRISRKIPGLRSNVCLGSTISKTYWIMEAAYKYFRENVAQLSPMLLCTSSYVTIYRYDVEHNTNLRNLLFTYIRNNKNIEKTAEECFMHRNTVKNKINLIRSLTDMDLDDPTVFMGITVSYLIIEYFNSYLGEDILDEVKNLQ